MLKLLFDFTISLFSILILLPFFFSIYLYILIFERINPIYTQERIGKNLKKFRIIKFRTMHPNADKNNLYISTYQDKRITKTGRLLRKIKIDELPQLFNVLKGDMSLVGPRPDVPKYIVYYSKEDRDIIFTIKPGITDNISIDLINIEDEIDNENPEDYYINYILPKKIKAQREYVTNQSFGTDLIIIFKTILKIFRFNNDEY